MQEWHDYPMGPRLRHALGISEGQYSGDKAGKPSEERRVAFAAFLSKELAEQAPIPDDELIDLFEELTAMHLPTVTLALCEAHPGGRYIDDFRALLNIGSSLMLEAELDDALDLFIKAHSLEPEELAPIINCARIHLHKGRLEEAYQWAMTGLALDANHEPLWELLVQSKSYLNREELGALVKNLATKTGSFAGLSLAAELVAPDDSLLKAQYLDEHYHQGGREDAFLIEYTAALGESGQYSKIPQILWEAQNLAGKTVPWQVYLHTAQAYLANDKDAEAVPILKKMIKISGLPNEISEQARIIIEEAAETSLKS